MGLVSLGKLLGVTDDDFSVFGVSFKDPSSPSAAGGLEDDSEGEVVENPVRSGSLL